MGSIKLNYEFLTELGLAFLVCIIHRAFQRRGINRASFADVYNMQSKMQIQNVCYINTVQLQYLSFRRNLI